ncbi:hypothetical protein [Pseudokineococcus sp. 1T1Z-3]|uniref:hypothetical protein n=1 Tax=Pseudokineococcus sp. 1T1Z-3 TaxID=3132745 RepID=UPI0030ABEB16
MDEEQTDERPDAGPVGLASPVVCVVVTGLAVEVLLLLATAALYLLETGLGAATSAGLAVGTAVLALALAALLGGSALGMARGRRRGRVPTLVWQVLQVLVALQVVLVEQVGTLTWWVAAALAGLGALLAVALLAGATTKALPYVAGEDVRLL